MQPEKTDTDLIDLGQLMRKVWSRRKLFFFKIWPATFVIACLLIICVPRYYTSAVKLAPEMGAATSMSNPLGSIASQFGLDLTNMQTSDAINPLLYPDLMEDDGFVASLFGIKVKSYDGAIDTDYYNYLRKYQKRPWWSGVTGWLKGLFKSKENGNGDDNKPFDPYDMSNADNSVAEAIRGNVLFSIDKKTGVISITVKAQDKLICRTVADSVSARLKDFITSYRTNKSRDDANYYANLLAKAKSDYETAQMRYANYADANTNVVLNRVKAKEERLEQELQIKYNTYTTLSAQYEAALAKVQEHTPVFTVLKGASVPIRPAGPKRMIFVIGMLFMVTIGAIVCVVWKDITGAMLQ